MKKLIKKISCDKVGFTLTEVMIGMMILTVAVVSATNLLVGLINSNRNVVSHLQAYYFAVEGIEAARNIRDTNWLHNRDWIEGSNMIWGEEVEMGKEYAVNVKNVYGMTENDKDLELQAVGSHAPWMISATAKGEIYKIEDGNNFYFGGTGSKDDFSGYKRTVSFLPYYECLVEEDCEDYVLVRSEVAWEDNELALEAVLTDWKGGVL